MWVMLLPLIWLIEIVWVVVNYWRFSKQWNKDVFEKTYEVVE